MRGWHILQAARGLDAAIDKSAETFFAFREVADEGGKIVNEILPLVHDGTVLASALCQETRKNQSDGYETSTATINNTSLCI